MSKMKIKKKKGIDNCGTNIPWTMKLLMVDVGAHLRILYIVHWAKEYLNTDNIRLPLKLF